MLLIEVGESEPKFCERLSFLSRLARLQPIVYCVISSRHMRMLCDHAEQTHHAYLKAELSRLTN